MMDMSIDEAKAKIWMDDVNAEINAVRVLLKKVNTANSTVAGVDDSIMSGIYTVGTALESAWTKMCNSFDEAQSKLAQAIAKIGKTVGDVLENVDSVKNRVGQ